MEDTGAASRGRAAPLPRAGRGGAGRAARKRRGCGGRCGGPSPALPSGPTSPSQSKKNRVAMKSDQSVRPPPRKEDRVCVVVPKDFKHGMNTLLWALLNVAKNGERLFIVHVHRHKLINIKEVKKKLGEYVSMCNERKVSYDLKITKNYDVAKEIAKLIDRHRITKLVMGGAAGKHYSEGMKSPEFSTAIELMKTSPLTCKIWFTCNGQLILTREANATVHEGGTQPGVHEGSTMCEKPEPSINAAPNNESRAQHIKKAQERVKTRQSELQGQGAYEDKLSLVEKKQGKTALERGTNREEPSEAEHVRIQEGKEKEKSCQRDLQEDDTRHEMSHLRKQIEEMETAIEFLELQVARNESFVQESEAAVTEAGGLYEKNDEQSAMRLPAETVNTEFSKDEIEESINCDNTLIGKGRSGSVYKGRLLNTVVAIKTLDRDQSMQGESDFIQKVGVLGRVRHPNLVTLIGVCSEVSGLVYEFVPNGSLQDQLQLGMAPLKWQVRIKIMREIWTVLTFLHSSKPPLVHGNMKASKVLLDSNFTCKLEAFGISQLSNGGTATTEQDVHSFGVMALQLLMTWLSPEEDVVGVVDEANKNGELDTVLRTTARDWPPELAKQLARIGLRCIGMETMECPAAATGNLERDVWKLFDDADALAAKASSQSQDEAEAQAPIQFKCPILWEVMVDPHVAADGHTYERRGIDTWFGNGKNTSPVTREVIADKNLTPNRAMKSMIEDFWEKQQRQVRTTVCDPNNPVQSIPPAAQSQLPPPSPSPSPSTGLHPAHPWPAITSGSLTPLDTSAEVAQLQLQPPPASSSPATTLFSSPADATLHDTSSAAARSHRLNPHPLPANPSAPTLLPPRPVTPAFTFLPPPTGIRLRRNVHGRLLSSSTEADVPGPGESSRIIRGKLKHA